LIQSEKTLSAPADHHSTKAVSQNSRFPSLDVCAKIVNHC
jgi:hypothetical protein